MKRIFFFLAISLCFFSCFSKKQTPVSQSFVKQKNGQFEINGKPYYFIGTNFWYGAILGSTGQGGNRERLLQELDFFQEIGINNLRVLVGADGNTGRPDKVVPALQIEPGMYNDTIFDGLDFLLSEMGKRNLYAVLYLNNSWEWSGGYEQYLAWAGKGDAPELGAKDWKNYCKYVAQYADCDSCHALFLKHIEKAVTRTNAYTGKKYADDPAILSWQVCNEPRVFSKEGKSGFVKWLKEATATIRSLDGNHLISTGNEGYWGSEADLDLYETIHADPNVDYLTIHIWPKNWSWIDITHVPESLDTAVAKTDAYINMHLPVAQKLNKPLVIEEFGYPRDNHQYTLDDPTTARDKYYAYIFQQVAASAKNNGRLAGCNFWSWGGFGQPIHTFWEKWDDYVGDPAQEEQGLNSVFDTDATIKIIQEYTKQVKEKR